MLAAVIAVAAWGAEPRLVVEATWAGEPRAALTLGWRSPRRHTPT